MRVGWIGLGKLGLPCALTMADFGHSVIGTDVNKDIKAYLDLKTIPYQEDNVEAMWARGAQVGWRDTIGQVVHDSDIVFIAVQTPHAPTHEGVTPTPDERKDFEYCYLEQAVKDVAREVQHPITVVVVSTVLPGTMRRVVMPYARRNPMIRFVYSPAFIAMGTASYDWCNPAIVLAGCEDVLAYDDLVKAHRKMHNAPVLRMAIESAELAKVLYNTFISMKIVFANTVMEMAHKTAADCDEITDALSKATDRIISPKYLRGGMGDGGGCHPRDNIALSWLAQQLDLSVDVFDFLMRARDKQTEWLGTIAEGLAQVSRLPGKICGREYKKNTNLTVGSPSRLLQNIFGAGEEIWQDEPPVHPAVFVIGTNHDRYLTWKWPHGSIVIDPWGYIPDQAGVTVIRVGRKS
jgi:UDPglucose 6-dehydrogenase